MSGPTQAQKHETEDLNYAKWNQGRRLVPQIRFTCFYQFDHYYLSGRDDFCRISSGGNTFGIQSRNR